MAPLVWPRFGKVENYVEPFFGSGAMLLGRPDGWDGPETVNDIDGFVVNFWRSVTHDPEQVVHWADQPVFESDLHARHYWLVQQAETLSSRLEGDPLFYDPKIAGWWVWGIACWIAGGFCSGAGSWGVEDGRLVKLDAAQRKAVTRSLPHLGNSGRGVNKPSITRKLPQLSGGFRGILKQSLENAALIEEPGEDAAVSAPLVNRQLPHLADGGRGVNKPGVVRKIPMLSSEGQGVNRIGITRQMPHLSSKGQGVNRTANLIEWFRALQARFRSVRVCCGDWERVVGPGVTTTNGITAVFLDPPYADTAERSEVYRKEDFGVAHKVREWAIANGNNPQFRIALCGYEGEHQMPPDWQVMAWNAGKGYAGRNEDNHNGKRERIWFSKYCQESRQGSLF